MLDKYYEVLGIPKDSSKELIKRAFRRKALELHPDKNPGLDTSPEFLKVLEAYEVLYNGALPEQHQSANEKQREEEQKAERMRKAREVARESMRERREIERAFYRGLVNGKLMKFANVQAFVFLLFGVLTIFNYFMPYQSIQSHVQSKNILYYYHLNQEKAFITVCGNAYQTSMQDFFNVKRGDPVSLELSFLFKDVMGVEFDTREGKHSRVRPHESLYMFFPLIPFLMFVPFLNLLFKKPSVRFYFLFFLNVFVGTAVLFYLLLDGGRLIRIFEGFQC